MLGFTKQPSGEWVKEFRNGRNLDTIVVSKERKMVTGGYWWTVSHMNSWGGVVQFPFNTGAQFVTARDRVYQAMRFANERWGVR